MAGRLRVSGLLLLLSSAACMASAPPTPVVRLDPVTARPPGDDPLVPVAFLAGCWRGPFLDGTTVLEERWTPPEAGLMLGTTRFFRDGRAVDFEFGLIRGDSTGIVYLPHPRGVASDDPFRLTEASAGRALFSAPEHDYPKRIVYTLVPGGLEARIDGGADDPAPRRWTLASVACEVE